jgi:transcriptional regulator with XRE-family HTH domain
LQELRWWSPDEAQVVDLNWSMDDECGLLCVFVEPGGELSTGVRVVFFERSRDPEGCTPWIPGGVRIDEEFSGLKKVLFCSRSIIVKERADGGEKMKTMDLKDFPNDAFRAILSIDSKQQELIRLYLECSDEVQSVVRSMFAVFEHPLTTDEDRQRAMTTITDALFVNPMDGHGRYGFGFLTAERDAAREHGQVERRSVVAARPDQLDSQEATFAERLRKILDEKKVTQEELAVRTACTQSAISRMLSRNARPQRKTIIKIAQALNVQPTDLWPNMEVAAILDSVNDFFVDRELTEEQAKSIETANSRPPAKVKTRVLPSRKGK